MSLISFILFILSVNLLGGAGDAFELGLSGGVGSQ